MKHTGGVAIYGVNYRPEPTGIGPYTAELAEHLAKSGTPVRVLTTFQHYPQWKVADTDRRTWRRKEELNGVSVTRLWSRMPKPMTGLQRLLFEMSYSASAIVHGPGDADVIVGVIPGLGSGIAAALHGTFHRKRTVIIVQDLAGQGLRQSGMSVSKLLGNVAGWAEGFAVRRADQVIAISEAFVAPLEAVGVQRAKIAVLPNWSRMPDVIDLTEHPSEIRTIIHAGSMGLKQGLDQVIDLARLSSDQGLPMKFVLVGDGSERSRLERSAQGLSNVEFRDPVREEEFADLLASADALLLSQAPSNVDMSFPSKLASYFAARRPVVAAVPHGGSVDRFLSETGTGVSVDSGNTGELARALQSVLTDAEGQKQIVENASNYMANKWNRSEVISKWAHTVQGSRGISGAP